MYDFSKINMAEVRKELEEKLETHSNWEIFNRLSSDEARVLAIYLGYELSDYNFEVRQGNFGHIILAYK